MAAQRLSAGDAEQGHENDRHGGYLNTEINQCVARHKTCGSDADTGVNPETRLLRRTVLPFAP